MKNIVIFGAPGSGKGTQSEKMIEKYGYPDDFCEWLKEHLSIEQADEQSLSSSSAIVLKREPLLSWHAITS